MKLSTYMPMRGSKRFFSDQQQSQWSCFQSKNRCFMRHPVHQFFTNPTFLNFIFNGYELPERVAIHTSLPFWIVLSQCFILVNPGSNSEWGCFSEADNGHSLSREPPHVSTHDSCWSVAAVTHSYWSQLSIVHTVHWPSLLSSGGQWSPVTSQTTVTW